MTVEKIVALGTSLAHRQVRQIAFVVPDAVEWSRQHSRMFGSGPFFVAAHYPLVVHEYRRQRIAIDVTSSYGQWGDVQVEFVQQHSATPSAYRDTYPDGGPGLHHVAVFVEDLHAEIRRYEEDGFPITLYAETAPGLGYAMMDTRAKLGIMTEFYEESYVGPFYDMIREAAVGFDGTDVIRPLSFHSDDY